jgi:hypothetical protein
MSERRRVVVGRAVADLPGRRIMARGSAVERQLAGQRAVFSTPSWSRNVSVSGSCAARSRAVALSFSRAMSSVSPNVMRIGVPSEAPASALSAPQAASAPAPSKASVRANRRDGRIMV